MWIPIGEDVILMSGDHGFSGTSSKSDRVSQVCAISLYLKSITRLANMKRGIRKKHFTFPLKSTVSSSIC